MYQSGVGPCRSERRNSSRHPCGTYSSSRQTGPPLVVVPSREMRLGWEPAWRKKKMVCAK